MRRAVVVIGSLLVIACGAGREPGDSDVDAGEPVAGDAGTSDGGSPDAGTGPAGPTLTITVDGARATSGATCIAIFPGGAGFPDDSGRAVFNECRAGTTGPFVIEGLEDGARLAVSVFHDANSNGALDTKNMIFAQVPSEGIGFSNNPAISFGPPDFEECAFTFDADRRAITITLVHLL